MRQHLSEGSRKLLQRDPVLCDAIEDRGKAATGCGRDMQRGESLPKRLQATRKTLQEQLAATGAET